MKKSNIRENITLCTSEGTTPVAPIAVAPVADEVSKPVARKPRKSAKKPVDDKVVNEVVVPETVADEVSKKFIYESFRVETYKTGEGKRRYTFDGRSDEGLKKARDHANKKFTEGCKVTLYKLSKTTDGEWVREDLGTHDGRKTVVKTAKTAKVATTSNTKSKAKTTAPKSAPKSASTTKVTEKNTANTVEDRVARLETAVTDLTVAVTKLINALA